MRISDWSSDVCSSDLDRPTSDQIHRPCSAILHPCQSDTLALRQQHPVLESVKAPFDHREGGLVTIAMMFGPSHHHCQASAATLRRAEEAITGLVGEAGLDSVGPGNTPNQGIVIALGNPAIG